MKTLIAAGTMLLMSTGTAFAQLEGEGDVDVGGGTGESTEPDHDSAPATGGGGLAQMGIETEFNSVGGIPLVHLLYALGGNYLDGQVGLSIENDSPDMGNSVHTFILTVGAGYRLEKPMSGRIRPYLEPYGLVRFFSDNNDVTTNTFDIVGGANLGVDFMVFDQFTLGAAIGGGIDFQIDSGTAMQKATVLKFGVYTESINATFYWG